jgi:hypothetical protein
VTAYKRALVRWNKGDRAGVVVTGPPDTMGAQAVLLLRKFQQAESIHVDGILGPGTYLKMWGLDLFDAYGASLLEHARLEYLYLNPYRGIGNLRFAGYDQGVDFSGSGPVYAVGPGVVAIATTHSGWPGGGAVAYRLTHGKAAGKTIYFCENVTPRVHVGQTVSAQTVIATMHDSYPYTESGWAQDGTDNPMSQPISHTPTYFGVNYGDLLIALGEHRCPRGEGQNGTPLPADWPHWLAV